jgi:hypothetical protein
VILPAPAGFACIRKLGESIAGPPTTPHTIRIIALVVGADLIDGTDLGTFEPARLDHPRKIARDACLYCQLLGLRERRAAGAKKRSRDDAEENSTHAYPRRCSPA